MWPANHRRFSNTRMIDESAFDFHGPDAVPRHVQHIIHASEEPEETFRVSLGAVACEVNVGRPPAPILLHVSVRITIDAPQHRWPGPRQGEQPTTDTNAVSLVRHDLGLDSRKRSRGRSRFARRKAGQWSNEDGTRFCLPPCIDNRATLAADMTVVPDPRFRIDWLAHRAEQPE